MEEARKLGLRDFIRFILEYEFESSDYGLETSEFTEGIIEHELYRLMRHRKKFDIKDDTAYVFIRGNNNLRIISYDTIDKAVDKANKMWESTYIVYHS